MKIITIEIDQNCMIADKVILTKMQMMFTLQVKYISYHP